MKLGFRVRAGVRSSQKAETLVEVKAFDIDKKHFTTIFCESLVFDKNFIYMQSVKRIKLDGGNASTKSPPNTHTTHQASLFSCTCQKISREHLIFLNNKHKNVKGTFDILEQ